jgi:hypothetical protein
MFDPFSQQPGNSVWGQEFQASQSGPLGDLEGSVAGVLNSSDANHLYIPAGPGGIIQLPRPQSPMGYQAVGYQAPPRQPGTGPGLTAGEAGLLLLGLLAVCALAGAVAAVAMLFIH